MGKFKDEFARSGISVGANIIGTLAGVTVSLSAGPFVGAAAGAATISLLQYVGDEFSKRTLSPRENQRIGSYILLADEKIKEMVALGGKIRDDDFFKANSNQSINNEVSEGIALVVQKEYIEDKIPLLANLYANILFRPDISRNEAHQLIHYADTLTIRQIIILQTIAYALLNKLKLKKGNNGGIPSSQASVYSDFLTLYHMCLIHSSSIILDLVNVIPANITLTPMGANLITLMDLNILDILKQNKDILDLIIEPIS